MFTQAAKFGSLFLLLLVGRHSGAGTVGRLKIWSFSITCKKVIKGRWKSANCRIFSLAGKLVRGNWFLSHFLHLLSTTVSPKCVLFLVCSSVSTRHQHPWVSNDDEFHHHHTWVTQLCHPKVLPDDGVVSFLVVIFIMNTTANMKTIIRNGPKYHHQICHLEL